MAYWKAKSNISPLKTENGDDEKKCIIDENGNKVCPVKTEEEIREETQQKTIKAYKKYKEKNKKDE